MSSPSLCVPASDTSSSYTSDYSQAKNVLSFVFLADGIPIVYAGQEQHYSGGSDPANREATWLSGYSTTSTLYLWIASTNKIRALAVSKDTSYITSKVCLRELFLTKARLTHRRTTPSTRTATPSL